MQDAICKIAKIFSGGWSYIMSEAGGLAGGGIRDVFKSIPFKLVLMHIVVFQDTLHFVHMTVFGLYGQAR